MKNLGKSMIRRYFLTGLLIWVPLVITLWVLNLVVSTMDLTLDLLPAAWHAEKWRTFNFPGIGTVRLPGVGALLTVSVVFLTGVLTANFIGQKLAHWWHAILQRIPIVKSIYSSVKQVSDTLFTAGGKAFKHAVLVEYPRVGTWAIGFQTGEPGAAIAQHSQEPLVCVYIPTTPSPTSGALVLVPKKDVKILSMSVDEALKYVVSMGVVVPSDSLEVLPSQALHTSAKN